MYMYENAFIKDDFLNCNISVERANQDKNVNEYGLKLIQLCYSMDLAVMNGRAHSDKGIGAKTFCGPQGESSVDFMICNKAVMGYLNDFEISGHLEFSDHKYVAFKLNTKNKSDITKQQPNPRYRPKWNEPLKKDFIDCINKEDIDTKLSNVTNHLKHNTTRTSLESAIHILTETFEEAGQVQNCKVGRVHISKRGSDWYDNDCAEQRFVFTERRKVYNTDNSDENRKQMCQERSMYRAVCRKKRAAFKRNEA